MQEAAQLSTSQQYAIMQAASTLAAQLRAVDDERQRASEQLCVVSVPMLT